MSVERKSCLIRDLFPESKNPYWRGMKGSPLFTVIADGIAGDGFVREIIMKSCREREIDGGTCLDVTWAHPRTGLEAELSYRVFPDTGVLECGGKLFNRGSAVIRAVKGPFSLMLSMEARGIGVPRATMVNGGALTEGGYPPLSYKVRESDIMPRGGVMLICGQPGGRSTEGYIPTAIVSDPASGQGFFLAYEWPCRSIIQINGGGVSGSAREISMWAHPGWTNFDLEPGGAVVIPRITMGFFKGDNIAGSNALRRHIARHVIRPIKGEPPIPPVFYNHFFGFADNNWTTRDMKREADAHAELGVEYFVIDANWFIGGFRDGIGNWDNPDPKHFPEGMENFARYVESKGMKYGTWLEMEYAMKNSDWVKRHPDWYRTADGQQSMYGGRGFGDVLLRLEDASVRRQVADWLEAFARQYRLQWLRWDFNNAPLPYWAAHEKENETGRLHLGYGEGLLELLDDFMARCPQVHIEACAGGGHRMDLGTLRRAHSAWMNDNSNTVDTMRGFQTGLNRVMTGNYGNSCFLWATHKGQRVQSLSSLKRDGYPPYVIRSRMAGTLGFAEQSYLWSARDKAYLKSEVEKYKSIRRFIMKDYYPIFTPAGIHEYDGWQFHDPETGEGYLMAFRCEAPKPKTEIELGGIRRGDSVELIDMDTGRKQTVKGGKTLPVSIPKINGTRWLRYQIK